MSPLSSWLPLSSPSHPHKLTNTPQGLGLTQERTTIGAHSPPPLRQRHLSLPRGPFRSPQLLATRTGIRLNELEGVNNKWIRAYKQPPNSVLCSAAFLSSPFCLNTRCNPLDYQRCRGRVWIATRPLSHAHGRPWPAACWYRLLLSILTLESTQWTELKWGRRVVGWVGEGET